MKAVILYKPNTELDSSVQAYAREFARETGRTLSLIDSDSVQGVEIANLYDILQSPAIIVLRDDGSYVASWLERDKWPTISELSYYN